jgi:hypothetical protein
MVGAEQQPCEEPWRLPRPAGERRGEQDQRLGAVGVAERELDRGGAAARIAEDDRPLDFERVEDDPVGVRLGCG